MSQVKKEGIRTAIFEAAFRLFTENGYAGTTLPMISRAAQVSAPNIYSYFPSKLSILYEIYDPWIRTRFGELDAQLARMRSPARRLRCLFEFLWRELPAFEQGFANNVIQAIALATPEDGYRPGLIAWMEQEIERMLLESLAEDRHGLVRGTELVHMIVMATDGYIMYGRTATQRPCTRGTIEAFCRMLEGGAAARPPAPASAARQGAASSGR